MSETRGAYLMARLTTKGLKPDLIFGGKPELERMDIAAACVRLQPMVFHLIMAKYCDDVHSALQAMGELQEEMCERSPVWAEMDPLRRSYVAAAMVEEFVGARKCRRCKGTGDVVVDSKVASCPSCEGSGQKRPSVTARARASEIPESTFRSTGLNEPFQDMMRRLADLEISALERISRKAS